MNLLESGGNQPRIFADRHEYFPLIRLIRGDPEPIFLFVAQCFHGIQLGGA